VQPGAKVLALIGNCGKSFSIASGRDEIFSAPGDSWFPLKRV